MEVIQDLTTMVDILSSIENTCSQLAFVDVDSIDDVDSYSSSILSDVEDLQELVYRCLKQMNTM